MLDGEFIYRHRFFATVIFQTAEPITTTAKMVKVTNFDFTLKLLVIRESPIGRKQQKVCLNAFKITVFLKSSTECCKRLVHGVSRNCANSPPKYITFHKTSNLEKIFFR